MKRGKLDTDIAVLELDEAHAVHFVREVKPNFCLLLNVFKDQSDRFGDVEKTAKLLETIAKKTAIGVVLNRDDPLIMEIADVLRQEISFFGYTPNLAKDFPIEERPYRKVRSRSRIKGLIADVELVKFSGSNATYQIDGQKYDAELKLNGSHNILNGAAALTLARMILGRDAETEKMITALEKVPPAFGRGETIKIDGRPLELILVKNPSGFNISLFSQYDKSADLMIAINNNYGDGLDPSWLNEVDFSKLRAVKVASGMCADVVARCLKKEGIKLENIEPDFKKAVKILLTGSGKKQIFCNYTAMLALRKILEKDIQKS
jgi:UDP-N-acetylmuramyl tripeptide synthase